MKNNTRQQRVINFIRGIIIPALEKIDLDYDKVVNNTIIETAGSRQLVEDFISSFINAGMIQVVQKDGKKILTIPDEKIQDYLRMMRESEKIHKEVTRIFNELEQAKEKQSENQSK